MATRVPIRTSSSLFSIHCRTPIQPWLLRRGFSRCAKRDSEKCCGACRSLRERSLLRGSGRDNPSGGADSGPAAFQCDIWYVMARDPLRLHLRAGDLEAGGDRVSMACWPIAEGGVSMPQNYVPIFIFIAIIGALLPVTLLAAKLV